MKKAHSLTVLALLLAGCGSPAYIMDGDAYLGGPIGSFGGKAERADTLPASQASEPVAARPLNATKKVSHVTVSASTVQLLTQHTQALRGTVTYTDGTQDGNIEWSSSDQTIVTVNPTTGEVSGVRPGNATIQARAGNDMHRFMNIPVSVRQGIVEDVVATVVAPKTTLEIGDSLQLEAHVTNSSTQAHLNGRWSSSNQQVAFVNDHGIVTARKAGAVTITFSSEQKASVAGRVTLTVVAPGTVEEAGL